MNSKGTCIVLFWLVVYILAVLLFALPQKYSVTVYKEQPPAIVATSTAIKTLPKVKKTGGVATSSPQIVHYKQYAKEQALAQNLDARMFVEVINCESNFNTDSSHDGGQGSGVTGFWKQTFNRYNQQLFNGELDYLNQEHQIKLMAKVFSLGEKHRHQWTSYTKYQKYGVCFNYQIKKLALTTSGR